MSTPLFLANLILQYDDTSPVWKDTAGTIAATTAGDVIARIDDVSGNAYNATLVTGRTGAVLQPAATGGKRGVVHSGQNVYSLGSPTALVNTLNSTSDWTLFTFGTTGTANGFIFSKTTGTIARVNFGVYSGAISNNSNFVGNVQIPISGSPCSIAYTGLAASLPGAAAKLFFNGAPDTSNAVGTALPAVDSTNAIGFGGHAANSTDAYNWLGTWNVMLVYNRTLLAPEILQLNDYYFNYFSTPIPRKQTPFYIVLNGNSINQTGTPNILNSVAANLGLPSGAVFNNAAGGKTSSQIIGELGQTTEPLIALLTAADPGKEILYVGWEGTNESVQVTTSLFTPPQNSMLPAVMMKAVPGVTKSLTATVTPGQTAGNFATTNGYIKGNWRSQNLDGLIDHSGDPIIGNRLNWMAGQSVSVDGLHPSAQGVSLMAAIFAKTARAAMLGTRSLKVTLSSATSTGVTLTASTPNFGTAWTYQFQQAPDASGVPGTWTNLGTAGTTSTNAVTGLTQGTPYWFRVLATDTGGTGRSAYSAALPMDWTLTATTAYVITGPTAGSVSVASTPFTVTPNGLCPTDTITFSDGGAGGTFTPSSLSFSAVFSGPQTFTYTPNATAAAKTLTMTSSTSLTLTGSPLTYTTSVTTATRYAITGPATGQVSTASTNFTIAPNGMATDTITLSDGGAGGTFTPTSVSWTASLTPVTFTYTPNATAGMKVITPTSGNALPITGAPIGYIVISSTTTHAVSGITNASNVGYTPVTITVTPSAVLNDTVTFDDNGNQGTFTPAFLTFSNTTIGSQPQTVSYQAQTNGARRIRLVSSGDYLQSGAPANHSPNAANGTIYAVTMPPSCVAGVRSGNFWVTPRGTITSDTVTPSDGGAGGTFYPASLSFVNSALPQSFVYVPLATQTKTVTITLTSTAGYTFQPPGGNNGNGFYLPLAPAAVTTATPFPPYLF